MDTISNTSNIIKISDSSLSEPEKLVVRSVREKEINSVADIITHSFDFDRGWKGWFTPLFKLGIAEDLRHRTRANPPNSAHNQPPKQVCSIAVYTESGVDRVVGTVEIGIRNSTTRSRNGRYVYISNLAVSKDFRRRGVAKQLLEDCEQIAKEWGYTELYLHVMADNHGGRKLYQLAGYETRSTELLWSIIPWDRSERLFLCRQLTSDSIDRLNPSPLL